MIVMSNHYWNEFIKYYIDNRILLSTLKYHQQTVDKFNTSNCIDKKFIELCRADTVKVSDVKLDTFTIKAGAIKEFFLYLKRLYSSIDAKVSFPVVVFMNDRNVEKPGVYSYDFSADKLHMIENLEGRVKELINPNQEYNMTICFFLNLIQALALYGRKGYIRGLEEIGYLSLGLVNKYENMNRISVPEQEFTHLIGVNTRHILLIETLTI